MGIALQIPAEGMENHDKAGSEIHGFILLKKHAGDNTVYGMEEAFRERSVVQEKVPKRPLDKVSRSPAPCGASPAGVFLSVRSFDFQGAVHR